MQDAAPVVCSASGAAALLGGAGEASLGGRSTTGCGRAVSSAKLLGVSGSGCKDLELE